MVETEPCPRCGKRDFTQYTSVSGSVERPTPKQLEDAPYPALSRVADVYICSWCGMDEAMRDYKGLPPIPPDEWPVRDA